MRATALQAPDVIALARIRPLFSRPFLCCGTRPFASAQGPAGLVLGPGTLLHNNSAGQGVQVSMLGSGNFSVAGASVHMGNSLVNELEATTASYLTLSSGAKLSCGAGRIVTPSQGSSFERDGVIASLRPSVGLPPPWSNVSRYVVSVKNSKPLVRHASFLQTKYTAVSPFLSRCLARCVAPCVSPRSILGLPFAFHSCAVSGPCAVALVQWLCSARCRRCSTAARQCLFRHGASFAPRVCTRVRGGSPPASLALRGNTRSRAAARCARRVPPDISSRPRGKRVV